MENRFKHLKHFIGIAGLGLASLSSHAACTTIGSTGTVGFKLAVASNFYLSAQQIAASFLAVGPKAYDIYICEGSSGSLFNSIVPSNTPQYALFLSADTVRPAALRASPYTALTLADPFPYAKGTPAFLISPDAFNSGTATDYLLTGTSGSPPGAIASPAPGSTLTFSNNVKIKTSGSPAVSTLAIATPSLAPYGEQTALILGRPAGSPPPPPVPPTNNMGQWSTPYNATTNSTPDCATVSSGSSWICSYDNINVTLDAINADSVTAGFVSYGQICPALTVPSTKYDPDRAVLFPDYPTVQNGILLDVTDSTAETKAADFKTYMLNGAGSANWNTWLTDHCYQAL